jgi:hypothetical protein
LTQACAALPDSERRVLHDRVERQEPLLRIFSTKPLATKCKSYLMLAACADDTEPSTTIKHD